MGRDENDVLRCMAQGVQGEANAKEKPPPIGEGLQLVDKVLFLVLAHR